MNISIRCSDCPISCAYIPPSPISHQRSLRPSPSTPASRPSNHPRRCRSVQPLWPRPFIRDPFSPFARRGCVAVRHQDNGMSSADSLADEKGVDEWPFRRGGGSLTYHPGKRPGPVRCRGRAQENNKSPIVSQVRVQDPNRVKWDERRRRLGRSGARQCAYARGNVQVAMQEP